MGEDRLDGFLSDIEYNDTTDKRVCDIVKILREAYSEISYHDYNSYMDWIESGEYDTYRDEIIEQLNDVIKQA